MAKAGDGSRRHTRRQYIVDRKLQLAIAFHLVGALVVVGLLYVLALFVLPDKEALQSLTASETRSLFIKVNLAYFLLAGAILWTVAILLTHRVAGPAYVLERALGRLRRGEYPEKITVRKRDYLKDLVQEFEALSLHLKEREERRSEIVEALRRCLEENDLAAARELVVQLGASGATEEATVSAPT